MLAGPFHLRIFPQQDFAHRIWNDFSLALNASKLRPCLLKCALLCNWMLGPFGSGTHQTKLHDAARHLMSVSSEDYLDEMSDLVAADRGLPFYDLTREEWLEVCSHRITKAFRRRIQEALKLL